MEVVKKHLFFGSPQTSVDNLETEDNKARKFIRNGQLFILRDGKTYTIQGREVK